MRWDDCDSDQAQILPVNWESVLLEISIAFGKVLRRLRVEQGLSQEKVGELSDLQRKYISLLERADYQPKLDTVFKLARALDCTPSKLILLVEEELRKNSD